MASDPSREQIQSWMVRLSSGDRSAFEPLFEGLWPLLRKFAGRMLADPQDAEDAAQQALLDVFRHANRFDRERDALTWVFGIAAWKCRTRRRQLTRRREEPLAKGVDGKVAGEQSSEEALIERELGAAVREVLESLSPADVETLLASIRNQPRPTIAGATFRKRLQRARRRLRAAWSLKHGSL